jgi:hypothetical protein
MWQLKNPEVRPATLDFSSSGQSRLQVSQLYVDGVEIINAIELVDWDHQKIQFLICEACGMTNCKSGDWVSLRRSDSLILLLPPFEAVGESRDSEEYRPPYYLRQNGVAFFEAASYEALRSDNPSFPPVEQIRFLSVQEATWLYHWNAPAHVLRTPPDLRVRSDVVLAASEGEHLDYINQLEDLIQKQYQDESPANLRPILKGEKVITLFLDAEKFIEWDALIYDGSSYRLLIDSTYVVEATALSTDSP